MTRVVGPAGLGCSEGGGGWQPATSEPAARTTGDAGGRAVRRLFGIAGAVLAAAALGAVAGCASAAPSGTGAPGSIPSFPGEPGGGGSGGSGGVPTAAAAPECSTVGADQVGTALGFVVGPPNQTGGPTQTSCTYMVTAAPSSVTPVVTIQTTATSLGLFLAQKSAYTNGVSSVSAVGQSAYSIASEYQEGGQNMVAAYDKGVEVTVTASASVQKISALINAVFARE